jgi:hypothetical protein
MKNLIAIFLLATMLNACKCDDCTMTLPYAHFYMDAADTITYPISENDSVRIYVYYKGTNWAKADIIDSNQTINLYWERIYYTKSDGTIYFNYEFVLDQTIGLKDQIEDLENYDYWIKAIEGPLQIKMSRMQIARTGSEGRCACEQASFSQCLRNDSITDYKSKLKLW